jgi:hypothetical protein
MENFASFLPFSVFLISGALPKFPINCTLFFNAFMTLCFVPAVIRQTVLKMFIFQLMFYISSTPQRWDGKKTLSVF